MTLDHASLPEVVALQLAGNWDAAISSLTTIRREQFSLLAEANRAICLFHLRRFEEAGALAPGLARLYPKELSEQDVDRLMMALLVLAVVAHQHVGSPTAVRLALDLCKFDYRVGDLPLVPTAIQVGADGTLTIQDTSDAKLIIFSLFCLQLQPGLAHDQRRRIVHLMNTYMRLEPTGATARDVFEEILLRPETPYPQIDLDAVRNAVNDDVAG